MTAEARLPPPTRARLPLAVPVLGGFGALGLVVAEFLPLLDVTTGNRVVETVGTGSHHSYAQLLVAVTIVAAISAAVASKRTLVLVALIALGIAALVIAIGGDLPDARSTGLLPGFRRAQAEPRAGLWVELLGGILVVFAAGVGLLRGRAEPVR